MPSWSWYETLHDRISGIPGTGYQIRLLFAITGIVAARESLVRLSGRAAVDHVSRNSSLRREFSQRCVEDR